MLNDLLSKIKNFDPFGWKKTQRESIFLTDNYDVQSFNEARAEIPPLERATAKWDEGEDWERGNPTQDLFFSMLKQSPTFDPDLKDGLKPLQSIIQQAMDLPEFAKLKKRSVGDSLCAGVGAAGLIEKVMDLVPDDAQEAAKEAAEAQKEADQAEEQAQAAQEMLEHLAEVAQQSGQESDQGQVEDLEAQIAQAGKDKAQAQAKVAQAVSAFDDAMGEGKAQFASALNQAIGEVSEESQDKAQFIRQFGLAAGYNPQEIDLEVIRAALDVYSNKRFDDFADMIGYAQAVTNSQMRQTLNGRNDRVRTRNMSLSPAKMTAPEKLASWGVKGAAGKDDWQTRAISGRVRHNEFDKGRKESEAKKGDIVVIRDDSGSTTGPVHSLFVSVEWQLLKAAKSEDRKFNSIVFSGRNQFHTWTPPSTGEKNVRALTDHFSLQYGGGTDPYPPVLEAFDLIESQSLKADIVILTDGQFAPADSSFLAKLEALRSMVDIRIYAVVVGPMGDDYQIDWANETVNIRNLADKDKIKSLFERTL